MRIFNRSEQRDVRRQLRKEATHAEELLWGHVCCRKIDGCRFRRQYGIGPYIVDFYCPGKRLAIEIDGAAHDGSAAYDRERDAYIRSLGIRILRFRNEQVEFETGDVVDVIRMVLLE